MQQYAVAREVCLIVATNYGFGYGKVDGCGGYGFGDGNGNEDGCGSNGGEMAGCDDQNGKHRVEGGAKTTTGTKAP